MRKNDINYMKNKKRISLDINSDIYIAFSDKVKSENLTIREVIESFMYQYSIKNDQ